MTRHHARRAAAERDVLLPRPGRAVRGGAQLLRGLRSHGHRGRPPRVWPTDACERLAEAAAATAAAAALPGPLHHEVRLPSSPWRLVDRGGATRRLRLWH